MKVRIVFQDSTEELLDVQGIDPARLVSQLNSNLRFFALNVVGDDGQLRTIAFNKDKIKFAEVLHEQNSE